MSVRVPQVLLVFADDEHRGDLAAVLAQFGVNVVVSTDCTEALHVLNLTQFAVVFCEEQLTDGDFRAVLAAGGSAKVIVCSRRGGLEQYLQVMQSGAYDFIVPPYRPGDLAPILAGILQDDRDQARAMGALASGEAPNSGQ